MALVLYVFVILGTFLTVSADDDDCMGYYDDHKFYVSKKCYGIQFCCGSCTKRYCCSDFSKRLSEDEQVDCHFTDVLSNGHALITGIISSVVIVSIIIFICCCVCPCCCLYKICRKPRPVVATTTHTTVVTTPYPQNTTPAQQYPGYQPVALQPGYGTPAGYGVQSMPSAPYQGQPYAVGPPPPYQESVGPGPGYPVNYSQAAFTPGQQSYPMQPPVPASYQAQPPPSADINATQPAYNPDYVPPPAKPAY